MVRVSPLETMMLMFSMILLAGIAALTLLGSAQVSTPAVVHQVELVTVDWLRPDQVRVPSGLTIAEHAAKHNGETEKIYSMLLEGKCAEVAKFCGGSDEEFAYFCVDPITGIVGAILQTGDTITTGFYERGGSNYWTKRIPRERWLACQ